MDGTLTQAHIDFVDMRKRTGIPVGDLFVAMESWEEPERIKASMDVILEIEAEAAKGVQGKEGLMELLHMLRTSDAKVALVTRNTHSSVAAFFDLIGEEWRQLFSEVRTREFKYVKPDKRLLLDVAQSWGLQPGKLLMSCSDSDDESDGGAAEPVRDPSTPGAPAPGLDFVDWLVDNGALVTASCSFPRMGAAAGGLQACALGGGNTVIHVGMGDGSLTKMMASKGLCVMGVDADIAAGVKRGLRCVQYSGAPLAAGSLAAAAEDAGGPVDAVLLYTAAHNAQQGLSSSECLTGEALQEYMGLLKPNGRLRKKAVEQMAEDAKLKLGKAWAKVLPFGTQAFASAAAYTLGVTATQASRHTRKLLTKGGNPFDTAFWEPLDIDDVVLDAVLGICIFKSLGGRFNSLMPSDLSRPGAFGFESVPAKAENSQDYASSAVKRELSRMFSRNGCHHCGSQRGPLIGDHMPPNKLMPKGKERISNILSGLPSISQVRELLGLPGPQRRVLQRFYPQCQGCSFKQSTALRTSRRVLVLHWPLPHQRREWLAGEQSAG
eukprot:gene13404-13532_t